MGGLKLTKKEKASGLKEIGGTVQPFSVWHDPETGQEFPRLPSDAPNAANYMIRGFRMGPAPKELKEKWKAGAADRAAETEKRLRVAKANAIPELGKAKPGQQPQADMVRQAVEQVLKALGHEMPDHTEESSAKNEETEAEAPEGPVQLKLL